jgi:energy-coupling factor transporter ATP-binding protein EcfA2
MRLSRARVQNYRSIRDTGEFEIEKIKTILVGPNEAGKTALLQALQRLNAPPEIKPFNPLRDYPRALYNDIAIGKVKPARVPVVTGWFSLAEEDLDCLPAKLRVDGNLFVVTRKLDNTLEYFLTTAPALPTFGGLKADLARLAAHLDRAVPEGSAKVQTTALQNLTKKWDDKTALHPKDAAPLKAWLEAAIPLVDEDNKREIERRNRLVAPLDDWAEYSETCAKLHERLPTFILFSNIFRVRPNIHLAHLASRLASGVMDDDQYDYGNSCLLKLLGFTASQLSKLGAVTDPGQNNPAELEKFRDQLDTRNYQLNAASIRLSKEIRQVWNPNENKNEASKLRLVVDGQYLKVVVEDSAGVEVELDQRSEGFQWLVSFFVVFFSESSGKHANSILLLDEPGVSLHALKQRDFRTTVTRLAADNQTIYTTHSPFMVGPDELDLVRVVEMVDRDVGTKVHTSVTSNDPAALLPLQEALGYDLAQSLFAQQRNLVCEGLTDYWYVEATAALLSNGGGTVLNEKIALIPSNTAGKVVYFATILTAHNLKVAALLDSDNAGDQAASQEVLVHKLGAKRILRTSDYTDPTIPRAEIEDLLRQTLPPIASAEFGVDVSAELAANPNRPIVDLLNAKAGGAISKYKLAKAYVRWTRDHSAADLSEPERVGWTKLITAINSALK